MKKISMKLVPTFAFCALISTTAPALSADAEHDAMLENGIALVKKGSYQEGAAVLRKVINDYPDNPEANYYLGMALNRTTPTKEAESFLKRSLMEFPENPGINFELGTHYYGKDVPAEAADYFEQVIELAPGSDLAQKSAEYLRKITEGKPEKNWEINIMAGGQYDSNVIINGTGQPLPAGYSGKSDWSALANLKANYYPVKSEHTEIGLGYSFYQNLHASLHDFDVAQNLVELSGTYAFDSEIKFKTVYSFEYLLLNGNEYDFANSIAPSLIVKNDLGTTSVDYKYRNTKYKNSDQFLTNSDRDGYNNSIGATHILPLSDVAAIWGLAAFDAERTQKQEWDYYGNRFLLGARSSLLFGIIGDVSAELYVKDYRGPDPQFSATRHDHQYTASVSLQKNFSEKCGISLSAVWSRNNSNIPEFQYERSITSLLLNARF